MGMIFGNADTTYDYVWSNVQSTGSLYAAFTSVVVTNAPAPVPETWLETYYPETTNYNETVFTDSDDDQMTAWQEYIAGTDPTSPGSVLQTEAVEYNPGNGHVVTWQGTAEPDRLYTIYWTDTLGQPFNVLASGLPSAYPFMNSYMDTLHQADAIIYYRAGVSKD
ncbi:MAG: hypothetical protein EOL87_16925 [Spartobacteria bacterium]|nr:hypothetical protein [Spartobacteria bacterium]